MWKFIFDKYTLPVKVPICAQITLKKGSFLIFLKIVGTVDFPVVNCMYIVWMSLKICLIIVLIGKC